MKKVHVSTQKLVAAFAFSLLAVFAAGCATTDFLSVQDPEYAAKRYGSVLVYAPFRDIRYQNLIESKFYDRLKGLGVVSHKAIEVIPPTREYSEEKLLEVLRGLYVEAILLVGVTDFWTSQGIYSTSSETKTQTVQSRGLNVQLSQLLDGDFGAFKRLLVRTEAGVRLRCAARNGEERKETHAGDNLGEGLHGELRKT